MNRSRSSACRVNSRLSAGFLPNWLSLLTVLPILFFAGESSAAKGLRVAVAPFVGDQQTPSIAKQLVDEIARREIERLIAPGEFVAEKSFQATAAEIRRWAFSAAVDTVVLGRVSSGQKSGTAVRVVEAVVRSGHSGVELSHHVVSWQRKGERPGAIEKLANLILSGLESTEPAVSEGPFEVAASDIAAPPKRGAGASGRGFDANFSQSGFSEDAPIEIKAEEAEIINLNGGRTLIFQRNVVVEQANVLLRSDRLEAFYLAGESQPRELRATGNVTIDQGDRRAECDRAIYLRESNMLTCYGHAKLVQDCDVVRGELIEFNLARDRARVEGAASIVIQPEGVTSADCVREGGAP